MTLNTPLPRALLLKGLLACTPRRAIRLAWWHPLIPGLRANCSTTPQPIFTGSKTQDAHWPGGYATAVGTRKSMNGRKLCGPSFTPRR